MYIAISIFTSGFPVCYGIKALLNLSFISRAVLGVVHPLLDVVYPPRCLGCGVPVHPKDVLCGACTADMMELPISMEGSRDLLAALTYPPPATMMAAGYDYEKESVIETCLHTLKYRGMYSTGQWLGRIMGERLYGTPIVEGDPVLLPVPLHKLKRIERGYNQAEHIAKGIAAETGLPMHTGVLERALYTESQSASKLSMDERKENLSGAFTVNAIPELAGRPMIVVDDIITTGATIGECVRALNAAGFSDVRIVAVAHPQRR